MAELTEPATSRCSQEAQSDCCESSEKGGALTEAEFRDALTAAGLTDVQIRETHRVHEHATSGTVRARKPSAASAAP